MSFFEPLVDFIMDLQNPWVLKPFLTALIVGVVCAVVGVFMILRGLVFFGNGIAHSAFAGGALGILLGINPIFTITVFSIATSIGIGYVNEKGKLSNETAIGIFFSFSMALGVIFISMYNTYSTDISSLLFGSLSSISNSEIITVSIIGAIIVFVAFFIQKELYFITFDEELAKANGMPVTVLNYVFLVTVALTIVVSVTTIGVILVMAFIVTPAATAYQFTYKLKRLVIYAVIDAALFSSVGFAIAYIFNLSGSATIAILLTVVFGISLILSPKRREKRPDFEHPYCEVCTRVMAESGVCTYCELEDKTSSDGVDQLEHEDHNHEEHSHEGHNHEGHEHPHNSEEVN